MINETNIHPTAHIPYSSYFWRCKHFGNCTSYMLHLYLKACSVVIRITARLLTTIANFNSSTTDIQRAPNVSRYCSNLIQFYILKCYHDIR